MSPQEAKQKLAAAQKVFSESSSTIEKLKSVKTLIRGINPKLDAVLDRYGTHLDMLENVEEGTYIQLSAEALPENTEKEKKRKAALLLFLKSWHDLKEEVARVAAEMQSAQESGATNASLLGKIFKSAKGPLALVTVAAIGLAALQVSAVEIEIQNKGCGTLKSSSSIPPIPGIALPQGDIPSGSSGTATIPPLTFEVDGTNTKVLALQALSFSFTFSLAGGVDDVRFNGASLIGKKTTLNLSEKKSHVLEVVCN